jgi:hypothetical protein
MSFFKNLMVGFLAFVFVFFNSGLLLNVHFCEGDFESITSVFQDFGTCEEHLERSEESNRHKGETVDLCCRKQALTHDSCCSDNMLLFQDTTEKITSKQKEYVFVSVAVSVSQFLLSDVEPFLYQPLNSNDRYSFESNAPPLYRLYCRYTYFG